MAKAKENSSIYTKLEVVNYILDLVGYTHDTPLSETRLLEPSMGEGDFLIPAIKRLLATFADKQGQTLESLQHCICAVEANPTTFAIAKSKIASLLLERGLQESVVRQLLNHWLICGDYLLQDFAEKFDFIVGNPPYVRLEKIPATVFSTYKQRYKTFTDRADIYVPFIEKSLSLLSSNGKLGFICSDRWTKNTYGKKLREYIAHSFSLNIYVDMNDVDAFRKRVMAYTAITILSRNKETYTTVLKGTDIFSDSADAFQHKGEKREVVQGSQPWILSENADNIKQIERRFPTLEEAGVKIGIGVATGADKVFIVDETIDIEPEVTLPLITTKDISSGSINWSGKKVINPFSANGDLLPLDRYPKLAAYLQNHQYQLTQRHCAKKQPSKWYRTIDRIWPEITQQAKLLIPDIKARPHIVIDKGLYYPHHNLYFMTSAQWDIRALRAVLRSKTVEMFISEYSTRMSGGFYRFQAQYLRKIRLPYWHLIGKRMQEKLIQAGEYGTDEDCTDLTHKLYNETPSQQQMLFAL